MVLPAPAQIPARVLAALVAAEGLGELHVALAPSATWRSPKLGDPVRGEVTERLTALGWRDRRGGLEREVAASLAVLCQPAIAYYGWITHNDSTTAVLAAAIGKEAVLAIRRPDSTIWLSNTGTSRLAEQLVAQTPNIQPGQGKPFTVSLTELHRTGRSGRQRAAAGVVLRRASPEVRHAQQLIALPTTGAGELYVATRDTTGQCHTHDQPVNYTDTTDGRYLVTAIGHDAIRISPADGAVLVSQLHTHQRRLSTSDQ